jgi:phospholipase/carboxylesterase
VRLLSAVLLWGLAVQTAAIVLTNPRSGVRTVEVGTGNIPLVLLHGYGSSPHDWLPYAAAIHASARRRFIFPEAPQQTVPPDGPLTGRGWWRLDLASYRRGIELPDMTNAHPVGLDDASRAVRTLLSELQQRLASDSRETILGGFSQGGMIAADIAFRTNEPLKALVLLSTTTVDEAAWMTGMPSRRGLPVFISHGRSDAILQFEIAERLATKMRQAGMRVTWFPFNSGHEMPAEAVTALNAFLAQLAP